MPGVLCADDCPSDSEISEAPHDPGINDTYATSPQWGPHPDPVKVAMEYLWGPGGMSPWDCQQITGVFENLRVERIKKEVREPFEKLSTVGDLRAKDDIAPYLIAIENVFANMRQIRLCADFDELQILETLTKCMDSKHVEIKKGACEIVTKMCNSEPDCKEFFTTPEFISKLLDFVYRERDDDFVTKALDALIAVLSDNQQALEYLQMYAGFSFLLHKLAQDKEEWTIKIATYFEKTCHLDQQLPRKYFEKQTKHAVLINLLLVTLISQDYLPEIVVLLSKQRKASHGCLIKLLIILVEENYDTLEDIARSKLDLKQILSNIMAETAGKPEFLDERADCARILSFINALEEQQSMYDRE